MEANLDTSMRQGRRVLRPFIQDYLESETENILALPNPKDQQNLMKAANMFISGQSELTENTWNWPVGLNLFLGQGEKKVFLISLAIQPS